jgi:hypothetical protein
MIFSTSGAVFAEYGIPQAADGSVVFFASGSLPSRHRGTFAPNTWISD